MPQAFACAVGRRAPTQPVLLLRRAWRRDVAARSILLADHRVSVALAAIRGRDRIGQLLAFEIAYGRRLGQRARDDFRRDVRTLKVRLALLQCHARCLRLHVLDRLLARASG